MVSPVNERSLPTAEIFAVYEDGVDGATGAGLECTRCEERTLFVFSWLGAIVTCVWCKQEHYVDKDYAF